MPFDQGLGVQAFSVQGLGFRALGVQAGLGFRLSSLV